ncbi:MAG: heptaprenyl diphosphate synthase [Chloroflexi bacterium]|nr:heptaprenyl diphosphate synthase [Chloroflexota bacterium]|tara:strand:+ start:691 stop:1686 length:996 start_codon:yes stop_codon:yes gene_type:complete
MTALYEQEKYFKNNTIYKPIQEGLFRVEKKLSSVRDITHPLLSDLLEYILNTPGKRVRPAITLLSANFNSHDKDVIDIMATAVEMLHIATLIHDDTVDDSKLRRGKETISNAWGHKEAVLVGDYLFAASATYVCHTNNIIVIKRFSETIMELSSGQLREKEESFKLDLTRKDYIDRIYSKTASLFLTSAKSGAILSNASDDIIKSLEKFAYNYGIAFQIIDDILDFNGSEDKIGKPVGNDLLHGILTLPTILALENNNYCIEIKELLNNPQDHEKIKLAIKRIIDLGLISESLKIAKSYCNKAIDALNCLPSNQYSDSLESLVNSLKMQVD